MALATERVVVRIQPGPCRVFVKISILFCQKSRSNPCISAPYSQLALPHFAPYPSSVAKLAAVMCLIGLWTEVPTRVMDQGHAAYDSPRSRLLSL